MADLQNVQEVVATMLSSHAATLASLQQTVSQQASAIASLTLTTTAADAKISNLEAQLSEAKAQIPALQSISPKVEALEVRLASTIHTVQEQWQQQMLSGRESPDRGSPHHGLSASPVRGNVASHDLSSLHSRVECLELKNHVESNNAEIKRIVHDLVQLRFEEARPAVPSPSPSLHAQSSRNDDLSSDVADLRVEVASLSQLLSSTATPDDLEDVRDELYRYIASLPSPAATPSCSKENDNPSLKNAILDEVAISRPDRTEIERLVMSRLEPIAGSLNTLHAEFATVNRHVNSLPPVPPGLVDQSQLGNTVNDAVRKALSGDGGRVSHAHLTVAIDNAREGMLRQMEGSIGSVRASLLENFSGELGNAKESTWDAVASLRGRVDDLERVMDVSNTEIVSVLNKKAYKNDVTAALSKKADKDVCMNTLRLKADSNKVDSSLTTKADAVETSERINQVSVAVTSSARDVSSLRDELRQEVTQLSEKLKRKVDVDEVEGLKLGVVSGADWRNAVSDVSMNIRRELADKANREEMVKMIRREVDNVKENVEGLQARVDSKSDVGSTNQLVADLESLSNKFAEAHSEARWLWRSGKILRGGWVPWEVQVNNAAPASLIWKAEAESVTCVAPGLYVVQVGIFTMNASSVQVCVNGEPVVSLDPNHDVSSVVGGGPLEYVKRRHRHTAGDITSVLVDEVMALPPNAVVGVRFDSGTRAQGFLSVRKL